MGNIKVRQDGETLDIATTDTGGFKVQIGGVEKHIGLVDVSHAKATKIRCRVGGVTKAWKEKAAEPFDVWISPVAVTVYRKNGQCKYGAGITNWNDCWDIALADYNAASWVLGGSSPYREFGLRGSGKLWITGRYTANIFAWKGTIKFDLKNIPGGYDWEDVTVAEFYVFGGDCDVYIHSIAISPFGSYSHPIAVFPSYKKLNALSYMGNENFEVTFTNSSYAGATVEPTQPPDEPTSTSKGGSATPDDIRVISYG